MNRSASTLLHDLLFVALAWIAAPFAAAVPIQITVTGEVTAVSAALAGTFSPGQSMSASFTYESNTPASISLLNQQTYLGALTGGSFSIGSYAGTSAGGRINVANDDPAFNDRFTFDNSGLSAASIGTHDPFLFRLLFEDAAQLALSDTTLPESLPPLGAFTERSWLLAFTPIALLGVDQTGVRGTLFSATLTTVPVPEPTVVALLLIGAAAWLLGPARVRRRSAASGHWS